jgi:hypothetical protein
MERVNNVPEEFQRGAVPCRARLNLKRRLASIPALQLPGKLANLSHAQLLATPLLQKALVQLKRQLLENADWVDVGDICKYAWLDSMQDVDEATPSLSPITNLHGTCLNRTLSFVITSHYKQLRVVCKRFNAALDNPETWRGTVISSCILHARWNSLPAVASVILRHYPAFKFCKGLDIDLRYLADGGCSAQRFYLVTYLRAARQHCLLGVPDLTHALVSIQGAAATIMRNPQSTQAYSHTILPEFPSNQFERFGGGQWRFEVGVTYRNYGSNASPEQEILLGFSTMPSGDIPPGDGRMNASRSNSYVLLNIAKGTIAGINSEQMLHEHQDSTAHVSDYWSEDHSTLRWGPRETFVDWDSALGDHRPLTPSTSTYVQTLEVRVSFFRIIAESGRTITRATFEVQKQPSVQAHGLPLIQPIVYVQSIELPLVDHMMKPIFPAVIIQEQFQPSESARPSVVMTGCFYPDGPDDGGGSFPTFVSSWARYQEPFECNFIPDADGFAARALAHKSAFWRWAGSLLGPPHLWSGCSSWSLYDPSGCDGRCGICNKMFAYLQKQKRWQCEEDSDVSEEERDSDVSAEERDSDVSEEEF